MTKIDNEHDLTVIVWGGSDPYEVADAVAHVAASTDRERTRIAVAWNRKDGAAMVSSMTTEFTLSDGASEIGALAAAVDRAMENGVTPWVALVRADVRVGTRWAEEMIAAFKPNGLQSGPQVVISPESYGPIGMVGAVSEQTNNPSQKLDLTAEESRLGLERYVAERIAQMSGLVSVADVIEGWCVMFDRESIEVLISSDPDGSVVDAGLGEWCWQDIATRLEIAGRRAALAEAVYVGRTLQVPLGAWAPGEAEARLAFYEKHAALTFAAEHKLFAVMRVTMSRLRDMNLLRLVLRKLGSVVDGVVLLLRNNPLDMQNEAEFQRALLAHNNGGGPFEKSDLEFLRGINNADAMGVAQAFGVWAGACIGTTIPVFASVWEGDPDEGAERASMFVRARESGATWVFAVEQDEMLEPHVGAKVLRRMLAHPDPTVRCLDVALQTAWDSPRLLRDDPPYGDGGSWRGGPHGGRVWRVNFGRRVPVHGPQVCAFGPVHGQEAVRVAAVRLIRMGSMRHEDREARRGGVAVVEEGMKVSALNPLQRIGFHQLVYERENADDVARWLDLTHTLCDVRVLVWTGEWAERDKLSSLDSTAEHATGPSSLFMRIARLFGAEWVHQPLEDDLAGARNAGIAALAGAEIPMSFAWFMDPDEWFADPYGDAIAIRRMAESTRHGWMMQVANYRPGDTPTVSDSVRLSRLDPEKSMRMNGRVHEGFGDAVKALQAKGVHPRLVYAPFVVQHRGMAFDASRMEEKLDKYERLLRLDLADDPHNPGAWVSLGWHYANDGHEAEAVECYERAVACAGQSYLPFKELGYHHLRLARANFDACLERLVEGHQFYSLAAKVAAFLDEEAPPAKVIARRAGRSVEPLPEFPPVLTAPR
jgi:hypothetical protein